MPTDNLRRSQRTTAGKKHEDTQFIPTTTAKSSQLSLTTSPSILYSGTSRYRNISGKTPSKQVSESTKRPLERGKLSPIKSPIIKKATTKTSPSENKQKQTSMAESQKQNQAASNITEDLTANTDLVCQSNTNNDPVFALLSRMDSKLDNLSSEVTSIRIEMQKVKVELSTKANQTSVDLLEDKIMKLEDSVLKLQQEKANDITKDAISKIVQTEIVERHDISNKKKNLIISNLAECANSDLDKEACTELFSLICPQINNIDITQSIRLGPKPMATGDASVKPRLLRISLSSGNHRRIIQSKAPTIRALGSTSKFSTVYIKPDLTYSQVLASKNLHQRMKELIRTQPNTHWVIFRDEIMSREEKATKLQAVDPAAHH